VTRLLLILAATFTLAAYGGGAGTQPAASPEATVTEQQPGTESTATVEESGTDTVVSERLAHWRAVVKPMTCEELAHLEKLRLAIDFKGSGGVAGGDPRPPSEAALSAVTGC
jgi:hypothetical protein